MMATFFSCAFALIINSLGMVAPEERFRHSPHSFPYGAPSGAASRGLEGRELTPVAPDEETAATDAARERLPSRLVEAVDAAEDLVRPRAPRVGELERQTQLAVAIRSREREGLRVVANIDLLGATLADALDDERFAREELFGEEAMDGRVVEPCEIVAHGGEAPDGS